MSMLERKKFSAQEKAPRLRHPQVALGPTFCVHQVAMRQTNAGPGVVSQRSAEGGSGDGRARFGSPNTVAFWAWSAIII